MNEIKTTRVDEFRQFKRRIRGSKDYLVVGLDIAKRKHHAFFGDANGRTLLKGLIVENLRQEPGAVAPHAGIWCSEGAGKPAFLPRPKSIYFF